MIERERVTNVERGMSGRGMSELCILEGSCTGRFSLHNASKNNKRDSLNKYDDEQQQQRMLSERRRHLPRHGGSSTDVNSQQLHIR